MRKERHSQVSYGCGGGEGDADDSGAMWLLWSLEILPRLKATSGHGAFLDSWEQGRARGRSTEPASLRSPGDGRVLAPGGVRGGGRGGRGGGGAPGRFVETMWFSVFTQCL